MTYDQAARTGAQETWNSRACEEIGGDKNSVAYFDAVSEKRYCDHPWMRGYFGYDSYAGKQVLEIGIGHGTDLVSFAKSGAICHGVDITDNHLQLTERNFRLRGLDVRLHKADATQLPFDDSSLDLVYSMGVIHHIPEAGVVLREVRRVLKPGGKLMIALYYKWSAFHIFQKVMANGLRNGWLFTKGYDGLLATIEAGSDGVERKPYVRLYTKASVRRLLASLVIDDVSVHHLTAAAFWPPFLQRASMSRIASLEDRLGWYVTAKAHR